MKKTGLLAMATAGVMLFAAGCGNSGTSRGAVALTVGNVSVTMNDISLFMSAGDGFDTAKQQMVEELETILKYGELGKAMDDIELTQEDIDSIIMAKASQASQAGGLAAFEEYLAKAGSSMDFLETLYTATAYQEKLQEKLTAEAEQVTENEYVAYLEDNYYRAKHILISTSETDTTALEEGEEAPTEVADEEGRTGEELANSLLERAKGGENFDELIAQYNSDPGMESNPDGYVFAHDGSMTGGGIMAQEFTDCVGSLEPGEFGICETSFGYHIIQRLSLDDKDEGFSDWLEQNRTTIKYALDAKKLEEKLNEYCDQYGIKYSINQSAVDAFTEDMIVERPSAY